MATTPSRRWHAEYSLRELRHLGLGNEHVFVNVGSGPGVHTVGAALKGAVAIGVDKSEANVLKGRKLAERIEALGAKGGEALAHMASLSGKEGLGFFTSARGSAGNAQFARLPGRIPLEDDSADRILSLDFVHTLPPAQRGEVLREMLRIAKPGAALRLMSKSYPLPRGEFEKYRGVARRIGIAPGAMHKDYVMVSASEHFALLAAKQGAKLSYSLQRGRPTTFRIVRK